MSIFESIAINFGRKADAGPSSIPVAPMNIFVGPNNSGKSLLISEIGRFINTGPNVMGRKIVSDINLQNGLNFNFEREIDSITMPPDQTMVQLPGYVLIGGRSGRWQADLNAMRSIIGDPIGHKEVFLHNFSDIKLCLWTAPGE